MKNLIIDRFEGNLAICENEDKSLITIPIDKLPEGCKEGVCLIMDTDGLYHIDKEALRIHQKRIHDKMDRLFE